MTNHTLLLMRHAKSDQDSKAYNDFDRPLNQRGLRDARKMGVWLKEQNIIPDLVVSSPALRAKQTVLLVCEQLEKDAAEIIWDNRIYEARLDDLLQVIADSGPGSPGESFLEGKTATYGIRETDDDGRHSHAGFREGSN
jgi:phosphohistidine phosphatase